MDGDLGWVGGWMFNSGWGNRNSLNNLNSSRLCIDGASEASPG